MSPRHRPERQLQSIALPVAIPEQCPSFPGFPEHSTAMLASLALNVVFVAESADVSKPCLMGETILNEYSIQLAFMPHLSLFLLDLS